MDIAGCAMPMQRNETIDEPRSRTEAQGELFDTAAAHPDDFRNRLIWGDNKLVIASVLKEFKGKIDLIYIDPPFDVEADFTLEVPIAGASEKVGSLPESFSIWNFSPVSVTSAIPGRTSCS